MIAPTVDRFVLEIEEKLLGWPTADRRKLRRVMATIGRRHEQFEEVVRFILDEPNQLDAVVVDERGAYFRLDAAGAFARWCLQRADAAR